MPTRCTEGLNRFLLSDCDKAIFNEIHDDNDESMQMANVSDAGETKMSHEE